MAIPRRICGPLALVAICAMTSYAQIFKLDGGTSTMLDSDGARLTVTSPYFDSMFSVGQIGNGVWQYGAALRKQWGDNTFKAGDQFVPFQMPNDIFAGSSYYSMRGLAVDRVTDQYNLHGSVGLTTTTAGASFFQTASKENPFGSLQVDLKTSDKLRLYGRMFFSNLQTAIFGFSYGFTPKTRIAFAAGMGANKPYAGLSFRRTARVYEFQAEYIAASLRYSRMFLQTPRFTEPQRENILGRYRPFRWLYLNASHLHTADPYATEPALARLDSVGAGIFVWKARFSANGYQSSSTGIATNGFSLSGGRSLTRWLDVDADWFRSRSAGSSGSQIEDLRFTEKLTQALTITEYITRSDGQNSILFGGSYNTQRFSLSFTNNITYVPFTGFGQQAGFRSIYSVGLSFPLIHNSTAEFHADFDPDGRVRYTSAGSTTFYRYEGLEPDSMPHFDIGKFLVSGRITDEQGEPIEGAVVRVGKTEAISDREGRFELRNRKQQTDALLVPVDEFVTSSDYQVVHAPSQVTYLEDSKVPETTIVVRRVVADTTAAPAATSPSSGMPLPSNPDRFGGRTLGCHLWQ